MDGHHLLIILWVILAQAYCLSGQEVLPFGHMDKLNGLSNNTINDIAQDSTGYLWIATNKGLNRFDGLVFKAYQTNTAAILQSDYVLSLLVDRQNSLWFGTFSGGLYRLDIERDELYRVKNELLEVNAIVDAGQGAFWVGAGSGLYRAEEGQDGEYDFQQLADLNVKTLVPQGEDLWLGTASGVYFWNGQAQGLNAIAAPSLQQELIFDMELVHGRELWIATRHQGIVVYDLGTKRLFGLEEKLSRQLSPDLVNVRALLKSKDGKIYIGTDGAGLVVYDLQSQAVAQFTKSRNDNSILSNTIFSMYEDESGNVWLGHIRKGISVLNKDRDRVDMFFRDELEGDYSSILCIHQDVDGSLWCGTDGKGLFQLNPNTNQYKDLGGPLALREAYVQSIFRDSQGRLWIGTFSNGVFVQSATGKVKPLAASANDVRGFCEDEQGNIWIATNGQGLLKYPSGEKGVEQYSTQAAAGQALSSDYILAMSRTGQKIYLATDGGGLNMLDLKTGRIAHYRYEEGEENSLLGDNLICLYAASENSIWVGSTLGITHMVLENGAYRFIRYSFNDLSFRRFILGILVDDSQQVWISTDEGVYRLQQEERAFAKVNLGSPFYTTEFHYNACLKSSKGKLYFGSIDGLFSFYPEEVFGTTGTDDVAITGFKAFGEDKRTMKQEDAESLMDIRKGKGVTVDAHANLIQIDFAHIHLPSSSEYEYAVQLENHTEDWQYLGKQRSISYENLPPGNYTFKVKSKDAHGTWGEPSTSFLITVLTPAWKTWWAILLYLCLLAVGLLLAQKYFRQWRSMKKTLRQEQLTREREEELRKMQVTVFTNISHDLRTPLTLVIGNIRRLLKAREQNEATQSAVQVIENNLNRLLQLSNELLDFRKIASGDLKLDLAYEDITLLVREAYYAFYDHALERGIHYELEGAAEAAFLSYDYDQFEKVLFNLLSNAFKFTPRGGTIKLVVKHASPKELEIAVLNTGPALSQQQQGHIFNRFFQHDGEVEDEAIGPGVGIGLSIVKDIVDLHQGRVEVERKDEMTAFNVFLKKGKGKASTVEPEPIERLEDYIGQEEAISQVFAEAADDEFRDATILIVEDNHELRHFIRTSLEEHYKVIEAENGKEALELALQQLPDLVISDVMMPEMDGITLCFRLKTDMKTSHIPVLLLTARKSRYFKVKGLATGADDYIQKPFYEDELKIRIRNLLKVRKALRERLALEVMTKPEEVALNAPDKAFIQNLCQIIEDNIDDASLKMESISQAMNMSHSLLYKKLKALTGYSLVQFIRDYRLQKAEMLLVQNQLSIAEICYRVGFNDRHYFSTCFKNKYQMSPRAYRAAKAQDSE